MKKSASPHTVRADRATRHCSTAPERALDFGPEWVTRIAIPSQSQLGGESAFETLRMKSGQVPAEEP
jgi:hypothetical protein